jgi:glycerol-3-phosphate dehydrogenase
VAANYVESLRARRRDEFWYTSVRDVINGRELQIRSKVLINACGPFMDHHNHLSSVCRPNTAMPCPRASIS